VHSVCGALVCTKAHSAVRSSKQQFALDRIRARVSVCEMSLYTRANVCVLERRSMSGIERT
jgi:hypothetical protein